MVSPLFLRLLVAKRLFFYGKGNHLAAWQKGERVMWWLLLVPALLAALYFLGILGVQLAWLSAGWNWGLPRWWRGRYTYLSGRLIRCFRAGRGDVLATRLGGRGGNCLPGTPG